MTFSRSASSLLSSLTAMAMLGLCSSSVLTAQSSNSGVELHAKGSVTAADIGLPAYPGATLSKDSEKKSDSVDMGFSFGDVHFRIIAASYLTNASAAEILDFYRKPLAKYGDVLECDHGKPVGAVKATRSGLTCSDPNHVDAGEDDDSSDGHELRAGDKHRFRVVGIGEKKGDSTRFGLVYVELPKDEGHKTSD
jgi:hypothetical protein